MGCKGGCGGSKSVPAKTQADTLVNKTFVTADGKYEFKKVDGKVMAQKVG